MQRAPLETGCFTQCFLSGCHHDCYEGGKNRTKCDQAWVVRAVFRAFGSVSHRLLFISSRIPLLKSCLPLQPTLYPMLAVSPWLSSTNLKVEGLQKRRFGKVRSLVVNQSNDHKGLRFRFRFLRYSFAEIFLASRHQRGFPCANLDEMAPGRQFPGR